jgi:hypothetical protein
MAFLAVPVLTLKVTPTWVCAGKLSVGTSWYSSPALGTVLVGESRKKVFAAGELAAQKPPVLGRNSVKLAMLAPLMHSRTSTRVTVLPVPVALKSSVID